MLIAAICSLADAKNVRNFHLLQTKSRPIILEIQSPTTFLKGQLSLSIIASLSEMSSKFSQKYAESESS